MTLTGEKVEQYKITIYTSCNLAEYDCCGVSITDALEVFTQYVNVGRIMEIPTLAEAQNYQANGYSVLIIRKQPRGVRKAFLLPDY